MTTFHRRRLPHLHSTTQPIFLTWRLHGSLPRHRAFSATIPSGESFLALDRLLDAAATGPVHLKNPAIAALVADAFRHRHLTAYHLHAFVIMPNHVHLLITPFAPVSKVMQSLKRYTAHKSNQILHQTGRAFWQSESYDHLVRNDTEFDRITHYIETNPVKAALAATPESYPSTSARPIANRPQVTNLPHQATEIR